MNGFNLSRRMRTSIAFTTTRRMLSRPMRSPIKRWSGRTMVSIRRRPVIARLATPFLPG